MGADNLDQLLISETDHALSTNGDSAHVMQSKVTNQENVTLAQNISKSLAKFLLARKSIVRLAIMVVRRGLARRYYCL